MQPYFFPYIGQFQLIHAVDRFILCDDVQYIRHGWINRNRILKQGEGYQYMIVPVSKHPSRETIRNIRTVEGAAWKEIIFRQIEWYRKRAPYYKEVRQLMCHCLSPEETNITRLNGSCIKAVCDYVGIPYCVEVSSEMNLNYSMVQATSDWALQMCGQLGATSYFNPPGGTVLYEKELFEERNIKLHFVKPLFREYDQRNNNGFLPGLSIIDVMMFNSAAEIADMLNDYQLL
ncbi:WbqC family protein [Paraflavitalea sp. CAU 1676]|uniref:WbqC family protein n=1 Tax=Paraflavitalea sp. CAU 1676 TaxID=3032598 RepID=UPI0023DAF80B|nr:WbqC family protein [Paraflavitalea sp. CAU 1676]MDF2189652.1 WbqC family protein [Paraflavitalea sp. CAU 1676]